MAVPMVYADMSNQLTICGPNGEALYPTPRSNPSKYISRRTLSRDIKQAISQYDHADLVSNCMQIVCSTPILGGAVRQMSEWAFAGDSWQPIHCGDNEASGEIATDWLIRSVFPNCVRRTTNKSLIKAMQVSAKTWVTQGDDLAVFSLSDDKMPKMTVIPGTCIGNGGIKSGWWSNKTVTGDSYSTSGSGYGVCVGGKFDGHRIYNGIIFDDEDEPIAARVLGTKRDDKGNWVETHLDFQLGFQYGAHLASPYDWHGMGRSIPRLASQVPDWLDFRERDDAFQKGIKLSAHKIVQHKLAEGQDAPQARGNGAEMITGTDANGNEETIWVDYTSSGNVMYIGSGESLSGGDFTNPHPNVEDFAIRKARECLSDLGWPYELTDLNSSGRAASRQTCELVNNSLWQLQVIGDTRIEWFVKFAIGVGLVHKHIPSWGAGPLDDPYKWTFGYPREMSVDAGNDVKAWMEMLRFGITSQRVGAAKWGYILKRIDRDRIKEGFSLLDKAAQFRDYAKSKYSEDIPYMKCMEFFYQPSASPAQLPNSAPNADNAAPGTTPKPKPQPTKPGGEE